MTRKTTSSGSFVLALSVLTTITCGPNQRILESANENTAAASREQVAVNSNSAATTFEQDLDAMRTADFNFIYVFRRKDSSVLNAEDRSFLGETIPSEMNRRRVSDAGRAVIIGSNFRLSPDLMRIFRDRFMVEDHRNR